MAWTKRIFNNVYTHHTAPSSPTNGDYWLDTSGPIPVLKQRVSGSWTTSGSSLEQLDKEFLEGFQDEVIALRTEKLDVGTGTQSSSTFRRGDGTWAVPPGAGINTVDSGMLTTNTGPQNKTALVAAHDAAVAALKPTTIRIQPGTYAIQGGINWDISYVSLDADNVLLDASTATTNTVFNVTGSVSPPSTQNNHFMRGFELKGTGSGGTMRGIDFATTGGTGNGSSRFTIDRLNIHDFSVGIRMASASYAQLFTNVDIHSCGTGLQQPSGNTNNTERPLFVGCHFYGCTSGVELRAAQGSTVFNGCSFDANGTQITVANARATLNACHIEATNYTTIPVVVSGTTGAVFMFGGEIITTGTPPLSFTHFISNATSTAAGQSFFQNVYMGGLQPTSATFSTGAGTTVVRDAVLNNTNLTFSSGVTGSSASNLFFRRDGTLTVLEGNRFRVRKPFTLQEMSVDLDVAGGGATLLQVKVYKNGTATTSGVISVAAGATQPAALTGLTEAFAAGDYISVGVSQQDTNKTAVGLTVTLGVQYS